MARPSSFWQPEERSGYLMTCEEGEGEGGGWRREDAGIGGWVEGGGERGKEARECLLRGSKAYSPNSRSLNPETHHALVHQTLLAVLAVLLGA
jgi:hypothetical protein